jgi:hypothetical protein
MTLLYPGSCVTLVTEQAEHRVYFRQHIANTHVLAMVEQGLNLSADSYEH